MINLDQELSVVKTVAITGHVRPDGDCVGSSLGLYNYILQNYPDVDADVYLNPIPGELTFLANAKDVIYVIGTEPIEDVEMFSKALQNPSKFKRNQYDLVIVVDCGEANRVGPVKPLVTNATRTLCIDHHTAYSEFADESYVISEYSSASELVFDLLQEDKIDKTIAECLYTGIINDTGLFQYDCTSSQTMLKAGKLMDKGIKYDYICEHTFFEKTYKQQLISAECILRSKLVLGGKVIGAYYSYDEMQANDVTSKDFEGVCEKLRETKGVVVAFFMYGMPNGMIKGSFRASGDIDISGVARKFNGGGHTKAAGFKFTDVSMEDAFDQVVEELQKLF